MSFIEVKTYMKKERINYVLSGVDHGKSFITSGPVFGTIQAFLLTNKVYRKLVGTTILVP